MCGIFGYLNYGNAIKNNDLKDILKSLSYESTVRGTDATGIAFVTAKDTIEIQKAPKSAYSFKAKLPDTMPRAVIGHTRHTTQGSEKVNINNHPFQGKAGNISFSLAHNGILYSDADLKHEYRLPNSKIQTDSYVAFMSP
ncbi:class II glutamine amidotransferase [Tyzzerella sp. OttesenSCG-928-J15]|nr:class II glutamine amidotransferase [Tyzzerella sp. OttesenSCG-928-J15]